MVRKFSLGLIGKGILFTLFLGIALEGKVSRIYAQDAGSYLLKVSAIDLIKSEEPKTQQWSPVQSLDGKKVVKVLAGNRGVFLLPAWWGDSPRPNEGELYTMEIDYRDDVSKLVVVSCFGNNAANNYLREVHRIGGEGTGQWKTAYIPLSWDYLYAGPGMAVSQGQQQIGLEVAGKDKDLPIAEVRVRRAALPGDAVRYGQETRTWVRKLQSRHPATRIVTVVPQTVDLPDEYKSKPLVPFAQTYLKLIFNTDVPAKQSVGVPVQVRMALNQQSAVQFGVYANGINLNNVTYSLGALKDSDGNPLKSKAKLYAAEYDLVQADNNMLQWYPHRLWPSFPLTIKSGQSQCFWMTLETRADTTKAGSYKGEITIVAEQATDLQKITEKIPIEVDVLPIKLLTMEEAGLTMGGCVYGLTTFGDISYAAKNNNNSVDLWCFSSRPAMSISDGKLAIDFTLLDEWMKEAKRRGWQKVMYFMGEDPLGFPLFMGLEKALYVALRTGARKTITPQEHDSYIDEYCRLAGAKDSRGKVIDEIRPYFIQWVKQMTEHGKANDWPDLILTPFDEPAKYVWAGKKDEVKSDPRVIGSGMWTKDHFEDSCNLIRENMAPGTLISGDIHHAFGTIFLPDLDIFCTNACDEDVSLGDSVRDAEKILWQYSGAGGSPFVIRMYYGFHFANFDSRGSLAWAYNWSNANWFDLSEGDNSTVEWPTPIGTIVDPSYEAIREGLDDRRYIETLRALAKAKGVSPDVEAFLKTVFDDAVRTHNATPQDRNPQAIIADPVKPETWPDDKEAVLDKWRGQIADKIVELMAR